VGCPRTHARSNWRRSGQKTPPSPSLLPPSPPPPLIPPPPVPPPPPPAGPGEDPAATASASAAPREAPPPPGPELPFQAWTARRGARGAGRPRGDVRAGGPPVPPGSRLATKVARAEVAAARRAGGRAWGPRREWATRGWRRAPLPAGGKYPSPPPASPGKQQPRVRGGEKRTGRVISRTGNGFKAPGQ
jgi:hypothetical protein